MEVEPEEAVVVAVAEEEEEEEKKKKARARTDLILKSGAWKQIQDEMRLVVMAVAVAGEVVAEKVTQGVQVVLQTP